MKRFVGIDLGTTNSAIATYEDGKTRIWQDRLQHSTTPSVIYVGRRGNRVIGARAYEQIARDPDHGIHVFKRFMGSKTKLPVKGLNEEWTPEQCSSLILKELMSYLPDEIRDTVEGTVVTVPAAFDQAKKNATLEAAEAAGIGRIALLQEPVAAIMSATQGRKGEGYLMVYDIGGGTLDISVAEYAGGSIMLHTHGGIEMCGGRDWDRMIFEDSIALWMETQFDMEDGWRKDKKHSSLRRLSEYAAEKAKIQLSSEETSIIELQESEARTEDQSGKSIYLDVSLDRETLNELIEEQVERSIEHARETLKEAGMEAADMDALVFVGGPTKYGPLRKKISETLGIQADVNVNPMTAVAEGAAIFAESFGWEEGARKSRKRTKHATKSEKVEIRWSYPERTNDEEARVLVETTTAPDGATVEVTSEQTGWTSGAVALKDRTTIMVRLAMGDNSFRVEVDAGGTRERREGELRITRAAGSIDGIPLSQSIGIEIQTGRGDRTKMLWLARKGDETPARGTVELRGKEEIEQGDERGINLKVYGGEHDDPKANKEVGVLKIRGKDLDEGRIQEGAKLICKYGIDSGGVLTMQVTVEEIRQIFDTGKNYYAHQASGIDYRKAAASILEDVEDVREKVQEADDAIEDKGLRRGLVLLDEVEEMDPNEDDPEKVKENHDKLQEVKGLLAKARRAHRPQMLTMEVRRLKKDWTENIAPWAEDKTQTLVMKMFGSAEAAAATGEEECEDLMADIQKERWNTLWKEGWYVQQLYNQMKGYAMSGWLVGSPQGLITKGDQLLARGDSDRLQEVVIGLIRMMPGNRDQRWLLEHSNVTAA